MDSRIHGWTLTPFPPLHPSKPIPVLCPVLHAGPSLQPLSSLPALSGPAHWAAELQEGLRETGQPQTLGPFAPASTEVLSQPGHRGAEPGRTQDVPTAVPKGHTAPQGLGEVAACSASPRLEQRLLNVFHLQPLAATASLTRRGMSRLMAGDN